MDGDIQEFDLSVLENPIYPFSVFLFVYLYIGADQKTRFRSNSIAAFEIKQLRQQAFVRPRKVLFILRGKAIIALHKMLTVISSGNSRLFFLFAKAKYGQFLLRMRSWHQKKYHNTIAL